MSASPAFIADFDVGSIEDLRETLAQLGLCDVQETAIGAEIVSRGICENSWSADERRRADFVEPVRRIIRLIRKYYPESAQRIWRRWKRRWRFIAEMLQRAVSRTRSSCAVSAVLCRATRWRSETGCCDSMLMFSDLKRWMHEMGVRPVNHGFAVVRGGIRARRFARQDGIVKSMDRVPGWNRVSIDGVADCLAALDEMRRQREQDLSGNDRLRGQLRQRPGHSQQSL